MATLATNVSFQCLGLDGKPLAGGKVYAYAAGTTTPKTTYTTVHGDVAQPIPVILDENGKAKLFLGDGAYRLRILDSNDALVDDIDQISRYVTQSEFSEFQQTVNEGVTQLAQIEEQIDVFVGSAIGGQKGYANGIVPLDESVKIDPIYIPNLPNNAIPQATELSIGVAKVSTQTEVNTATDDATIVTPKKLLAGIKNHLTATGNTPMFACRTWLNFDGSSATPLIRASGNITSITDNGTGDYTANFTTAFSDANYLAVPTAAQNVGVRYSLTPTTTTLRMLCVNTSSGGAADPDIAGFAIFR